MTHYMEEILYLTPCIRRSSISYLSVKVIKFKTWGESFVTLRGNNWYIWAQLWILMWWCQGQTGIYNILNLKRRWFIFIIYKESFKIKPLCQYGMNKIYE